MSDSSFDVLRLKSFRLLWLNTLGFTLVQSTQRFAFVWLILELGAKSDVSGMLLFVMGLPALFISLPIGVFSDRMNRRALLISSQIGAFGITLCTAIYVSSGHITTFSATVCAAILGLFIAIGQPVRTAVVSTLVPKEQLMNAIIVSTVASNLALIFGPALAGPAISRWGIEGAFWVQALLYGLGLLTLFPLKLPPPTHSTEARHLGKELQVGMRYIWANKNIRVLFILLSGSVLFMMSPWMVLGPQFVREQVGATGGEATILYSLLGVGQFCTSMWILRNSRKIVRKGLWFMCGLCTGATVQIFIGPATHYWYLALVLFAWGLTGGFYLNLNQTLIQHNTPANVMGRVMSVHSFFNGGYRPHGRITCGLHREALAFAARNNLYYRGTDACIGSDHDGHATRLPFNVLNKLR